MIKAAKLLFRLPAADKPTVLLMIDRNELEDQMLKNLASLGLGNVEHASSIARLNQLLASDYRGIIVAMIRKFRDMPADLNTPGCNRFPRLHPRTSTDGSKILTACIFQPCASPARGR